MQIDVYESKQDVSDRNRKANRELFLDNPKKGLKNLAFFKKNFLHINVLFVPFFFFWEVLLSKHTLSQHLSYLAPCPFLKLALPRKHFMLM